MFSIDFKYELTPKLFNILEKSPKSYLDILKQMAITNQMDIVYKHLNDFEHTNCNYHGNNALHCLCMIMSKNKNHKSKNKNYGINTKCNLDLGLEILDFITKAGVNLYHRDFYNDTPLDYVNDSLMETSNWKLDDEFVKSIKNIYHHFDTNDYIPTYNNQKGDIRYKYSDRFYEIINLKNITESTKDIIIDRLLQKNISYNDSIYKILSAIDNIKLEYKFIENPII